MPKLKANSRAKKSLRCTSNGDFLHKKVNRRHLLTKKTSKRKRQLRGSAMVDNSNKYMVGRLLSKR